MNRIILTAAVCAAALCSSAKNVDIVVDIAARPIAAVDAAAHTKLGSGPARGTQDTFSPLAARTTRMMAAFDDGKTVVSQFNGRSDRIWTRYLSLALRDHRKALAHGKDGSLEYLSLEGHGQNCIVAVNTGYKPVRLTVTLKGRQSGNWVMRLVSSDVKTGAVSARAWGGYCRRGAPVEVTVPARSLATVTYRAR